MLFVEQSADLPNNVSKALISNEGGGSGVPLGVQQ
jgi:hypothetical protein